MFSAMLGASLRAQATQTSSSLQTLCERIARNDPSLSTDLKLAGYDTGEKIGDGGVIALAAALKTNTRVKGLVLCSNNITATGAAALFRTLQHHNTSVERVNLRDNQVGRDEKAAMAALSMVGQTRLKKLVLTDNGISDVGASCLAKSLTENACHLEILYLSNNPIGDNGAIAFGETFALTTNLPLKVFYLSWCQIGNEGVKGLAEGIQGNETLKEFGLNGNIIGNQGAKSLARELRFNSGLEQLLLYENCIGKEGHESLVREGLRHNYFLKMLVLDILRDPALQEEKLFYTQLNMNGRRLLKDENAHSFVWAHLLSQISDPELMYYCVRAKPELFLGPVAY